MISRGWSAYNDRYLLHRLARNRATALLGLCDLLLDLPLSGADREWAEFAQVSARNALQAIKELAVDAGELPRSGQEDVF